MKTRKIIVGLVILAVVFSIPSWSFAAKRTLPKESSKGNKIILEYEFTAPSASKKGEYDLLEMEGLKLYQRPGAPIVPVRPAEVLIPFGKKVVSSKAVASDIHKLSGTYRLAPGQEPYPLNYKGVIKPTEPNQAIYGKAKPWPGIDLEQMSTQSKRGYQIFVLKLFPLQYVPTTGTVSYAGKLRLEITLADARKKGILRPTKELKERLSATMDNPSVLGTYLENSQITTLGQSQSLTLPLDDYRYVIITNEALEEASGPWNFQALRDSKIARGISATIVTTEWIYDNYPGITPKPGDDDNDEATKIRNFLIDAYNHWGTEYVLLGGEIDIIPVRKLFVDLHTEDGKRDNIPADIYYGCVEPNECTFDNDANGRYGEPNDGVDGGDVDLCAEIYVGRAPVENSIELSNFIRKTLTYNATTNNYLTRAAMLGEHIGFGGPTEYATDSMEQIRQGGYYDGYCTTGFNTVSTIITEGYLPYPYNTEWPLYDEPPCDRDDCTYYGICSGCWPKEDVIALMNGGMHIFNHLGHGYPWKDMTLWNDDLSSLTNTDYFFVYSQACLPGAFDFRDYQPCCFAEAITSMEHGAFAVIMNSREGLPTPGSTDGPSQRFNREFWDAVLGEGILELGRANQDSKEDNLYDIDWEKIRWCYYELNLFGDPETRLATRYIKFTRDYYSCSDEVEIKLVDSDLTGEGNQYVRIETLLGGDVEDVNLTEVNSPSGVFTGTIYTDGNTACPNDGVLQVSHGDIITVPDMNGGNDVYATNTAEVDCQPSVISGVTYEWYGLVPGSLTIAFETSEPTFAKIRCGLDCNDPCDAEATDGRFSTEHSVELGLDSLSPHNQYHFVVEATDRAGNVTVDNNNGNCYSFLTFPRDIYVPGDFDTIQEAIDDSDTFDDCIIWVSPGTYTGTGNRDIDFMNKAITVKSTNPTDPCVVSATIIDCGGSRNSPHCGFYFHRNEDHNSVVDGFTIINGYGPYVPFDSMYVGGAIHCSYGSGPAIRRCIFKKNMNDKTHSDTYGGAVGCYAESWSSVSPLIENCIIYDNEAYYGGGISTVCMSPTVRNCIIRDNNAVRGGGIDLFWVWSPYINNCTIVNNSASTGGGINNNGSYSTETITNCILWGNGDDLYDCSATYSCISDCNDVNAANHNICDDPRFIDADSNNFHIGIHSPCVNAGKPGADYNGQVDIDGEPRVLEGRVDIGADETFYPNAHWWRLNETSGTTAHDSVGTANGTFNGNDPCWGPGLFAGAVDFNGVKDYFSVPSLDTAYSNSSVFTIAGWFRTDQSSGMQTIVGQWGQGGTGTECWGWQVLVENNKVKARFMYNEFTMTDITGTSDVNDGEWHQFAMVRNGTSVVVYVDGEPENSGTANFSVYETKFRIGDGSYVDNPGPPLRGGPFNGIIDDVMIFNRVLLTEEVELLYVEGINQMASNPNPADGASRVSINSDLTWTAGNQAETHDVYFGTTNPPAFVGNQTGTTFEPNTLNHSTTYYWRIDEKIGVDTTMGNVWSFTTWSEFYQNLAHWWRLDETSGTTAHDSIGTANGTFNGNDPCWTNGLIGGAVDFNGVKDYFSVPSLDTAYTQNSVFTVAGWFKTSETSGLQTIVGQWSQMWEAGQEYFGWQVLVENNKVIARFGYGLQTPDITGTTPVTNDNKWHHFAMVRNGTSTVLYVDGEPEDSDTVSFYVYNTKFRIGDGSYVTSGSPALKGGPFNGIIDDVMIFNRVLSTEEVEQLYQEGSE